MLTYSVFSIDYDYKHEHERNRAFFSGDKGFLIMENTQQTNRPYAQSLELGARRSFFAVTRFVIGISSMIRLFGVNVFIVVFEAFMVHTVQIHQTMVNMQGNFMWSKVIPSWTN